MKDSPIHCVCVCVCVCIKAYLNLSLQSADDFVLRLFSCGTDRLKSTSDLSVTLSVFSS